MLYLSEAFLIIKSDKNKTSSLFISFWNSSFDEDIMPFIINPKQKQIERIVGSIQDQVLENILVAGLPLACLATNTEMY